MNRRTRRAHPLRHPSPDTCRQSESSPPDGESTSSAAATPERPAATSFADFGLPAELLAALGQQGITVPFPIQATTLPDSLAGRDVLGRGRTGSGKTLAFGLALIARTAGSRAEPCEPLALVLVPTRELAQQITDALTPYARALRLRLATVVGGVSIRRQVSVLRTGAEVVVATPGRLTDLIERGDCRLDRVRITVLDEADRMADMGFMPQVTTLLRQVPADGQHLLFSATLDHNVDALVRRFLTDPVAHSVDPPASAVTTMEHHVLHVAGTDKHTAVTRIAARDSRVIMFLDTKHAVNRLARDLLALGIRAAALHGGKSQAQRNRVLEQFRGGRVMVLVATDVAARGIHVDKLDLVVNVDPPTDHKDYLHRSGRTARAGEAGRVVTLVLPGQRRDVARLMADAGVTPRTAQVHSGDAEFARITGARTPSGVPVDPGTHHQSAPRVGRGRRL
ncbi:DEAD/DEAH box helicase [Streptomyces sp. NPDC054933]